MRPHCAAESTLLKKKRRLLNWINNPEQAEKEADFWRSNVTKSRDAFAQFESDREAWLEGFEEARRMLSGALKGSIDANKHLREEGVVLHTLCEQECGYSLRKKRNFHTKDIVDEVVERQGAYESAIQEYLGITHELHAKGTAGAAGIPVAYLSLDEVHYPEDDVYIVNKNRARKAADSKLAVTNQDKETAMDVDVKAEPSVKVEAGGDAEVVEEAVEQRQCISDIPLPYFCSESKLVIPADVAEPSAQSANAPAATVPAGASRKGRSSSIGSLKDLPVGSAPLGVVKTERSTSGGTSSEGVTDTDATTTHPSSATSASQRSWSPSADAASAAHKVPDDLSLLELLLSVQESVRLNELSLTDVEFMFQDRTTCPDDKTIISAILGGAKPESDGPAVSAKASRSSRDANQEGLTAEEQKALASPYLALSRAKEQDWSSYCDQLFEGLNAQGIITRKGKKRGPEYMQVTVDLRLRTQRGVSLLYSPLSQYEDRLLGATDQETIYKAVVKQSTGDVTYHSTTQLPPHLRKAEDDALARCKLQSAAAVADLSIRKLRASLKEIAKFTQEAQSSLQRSESLHEMATVEEGLELRRMYKELVHYGLVKAGLDDPPMSPLSSNAAAAAASAMFNSVYPASNNHGHGKSQSKSRAPARVYVRPSAASAHANGGIHEDATSSESLANYDAAAPEEESLKRKIGVASAPSATTLVASAPKRRR